MTAIIRISSKCLYACKALVALAGLKRDEMLQLSDIARIQGIPERFLAHVLVSLKRKAIVKSERGKNGGYRLGRSPRSILLGEVVDAVCEISGSPRKGRSKKVPESSDSWRLEELILAQWDKAGSSFLQTLNKLSLEDMVGYLDNTR